MTNEIQKTGQIPETQSDSDWFLAETTRSTGLKKLLWQLGYSTGRKACFFSKAPQTEGIPETQQEQNRLKLIWLKTRARLNKIGVTLTFAERKRLALSDQAQMYRNFGWGQKPSFEIDEPIRSLAQALNERAFTYSGESCSGHLKENPENPDECMFFDTGYITIRTDETSKEVIKLIEAITKLCEEETEKDQDCKYFITDNEDGSYTLRWNFKDPEFEEAKRDLYKPGIQNTSEEKAIYRRIRDLSPRVREKQIIKKHRAFLEKVGNLIKTF